MNTDLRRLCCPEAINRPIGTQHGVATISAHHGGCQWHRPGSRGAFSRAVLCCARATEHSDAPQPRTAKLKHVPCCSCCPCNGVIQCAQQGGPRRAAGLAPGSAPSGRLLRSSPLPPRDSNAVRALTQTINPHHPTSPKPTAAQRKSTLHLRRRTWPARGMTSHCSTWMAQRSPPRCGGAHHIGDSRACAMLPRTSCRWTAESVAGPVRGGAACSKGPSRAAGGGTG